MRRFVPAATLETLTPSEATRWLRAYATAWEPGDSGVTALFTGDATYRSHVFREPHEGHAGIRSYWESATSTQSDVRVLTGDPLVDAIGSRRSGGRR